VTAHILSNILTGLKRNFYREQIHGQNVKWCVGKVVKQSEDDTKLTGVFPLPSVVLGSDPIRN